MSRHHILSRGAWAAAGLATVLALGALAPSAMAEDVVADAPSVDASVVMTDLAPTQAEAVGETPLALESATGGSATAVVSAPQLSATPTDVVGPPRFVLDTPKGDVRVGDTFAAVMGKWTPSTTTFTYQWMRAGTPINAANSVIYQLTSDDIGSMISVVVTGSAEGYSSKSIESSSSPVVLRGLIKGASIRAMSSSGVQRVGNPFSAKVVVGSPTHDVVWTYQWSRAGVVIPGETSAVYLPVDADRGSKLTLTVTFSAPGYETIVASVRSGTIK